MVRAAEASAVGGVKRGTAVSSFDDMVGKHAMVRGCLGAAPSAVDGLAPIACPAQDGLTPCLVLWGEQFGVGPLLGHPCGPGVDRPDGRGKHAELGHRSLPLPDGQVPSRLLLIEHGGEGGVRLYPAQLLLFRIVSEHGSLE